MTYYYKRCGDCRPFTWFINKGSECSWCGLDYKHCNEPEVSSDEPLEMQYEKAWSE